MRRHAGLLVMLAGIATSALSDPTLGLGLLLIGAGVQTGSWRLLLVLGALGGWGAALAGADAELARAAGAGLTVLTLTALCLLPAPDHPAVAWLARIAGAGGLLLAVPGLDAARAAWWPLLMVAGFVLMGLGALQALQPGKRWVPAAVRANTGLVLLLAGLDPEVAWLALAAMSLGELAAILAERAGGQHLAGLLAAATLGGLPPLGMWAWAGGLQVLHGAGFGIAPAAAWLLLAVGAMKQLRATQAAPPGTPAMGLHAAMVAAAVAIMVASVAAMVLW